MKPLASRWLMRPWRSRTAVLALAALVWLVWLAVSPGSLRQLDERSTDFLWRLTASETPERRVIFIDIDDASLAQVGSWPWPREVMAQLTRKLDQQGVGLKLFDVVFPDGRDGSAELSRALAVHDAESPSVLAQVFALRNESQLRSGALAGAVPGVGCQTPSLPAQGFIANAPGLHQRAGHITPTLDADGAVRRIPGFVCFDDHTYSSLTLAGLAALVPPVALDAQAQRLSALLPVAGVGPWQPAWQLVIPSLPGSRIGMDAQGQIRVPYGVSRKAMTAISAADVLQDKVPAGMLKDAWVIVGASAFGLADAVPTALGGAVSGAEVHLQLMAAMLDDAVPYTPMAAGWLQWGYVLLSIGGLLALAAGQPLHERRAVLLLPLAAAALAGLGFVLHAAALLQAGWFVGWATAALAIGLAGTALALGEHARSLFEKGRLYRNLSSYVPSPVAAQIALTEPTGDIEARRGDVTVLAADLQNFSRYCEARSPEDAARVLHRFFSTAETIIQAHGGVVEEMVGDNLLAVFNGPLACENHPLQALAAARELWLRCNEELPNTAGIGLEPLSVSIGLESGMALVGSFGPARRRVHTVLGQTVTVALRLQALTADLAYPMLVGQSAAERVGPLFEQSSLALKPLGSFLLPGLQQPCKVFTLRTLLQPGSIAEQSTLHYLHQQQKNSAA
ncbi:adenylate cyclase [Polaromonas sp. OV174]|uniref:CHASE2 domain-containing protein n=1 Tax=Polaromonas sp. OV174 TaxID=1855300 RepID=UPI0008F36FDE|nr:adenylate/guanylate cyclase domain-containing protein [Polaromonas sp. OV174]SFC17341.1 adenylate cyclase [Polaromonas sp. OV174]